MIKLNVNTILNIMMLEMSSNIYCQAKFEEEFEVGKLSLYLKNCCVSVSTVT